MSRRKDPSSEPSVQPTRYHEATGRQRRGEASCDYLPVRLASDALSVEPRRENDPVRDDSTGKFLWASSGTWSVTMGAA